MPQGAIRYCEVLLGAIGCHRVLLSTIGCCGVLLGAIGCCGVPGVPQWSRLLPCVQWQVPSC